MDLFFISMVLAFFRVSSQSIINATIGDSVELKFKLQSKQNTTITLVNVIQNGYEKEVILSGSQIEKNTGIFNNNLDVKVKTLRYRASAELMYSRTFPTILKYVHIK
jgi:hypothetical protein